MGAAAVIVACSVCGTPLAGRRRDAQTCSVSCRRERSRMRALEAGRAVPGYATLADYQARRQRRANPTEKIGPATVRPTRTSRAREFVLDHCIERPRHRTTASYAYRAYQRWARDHEPDRPLSYASFLAVLECWAPIEDRTTEHHGKRGRSRVVYVGIVVQRLPDPSLTALAAA